MGLLQDFVIPEADNGEPEVLQVLCPCFVIGGLSGVLAAVYFDNQFGFHANEIEDVLSQRLLAAKAVATQSFAAQVLPQAPFGRRHVLAQLPPVCNQTRVVVRKEFFAHFFWVFVAARVVRCPHPAPPPRGRGQNGGSSALWLLYCKGWNGNSATAHRFIGDAPLPRGGEGWGGGGGWFTYRLYTYT